MEANVNSGVRCHDHRFFIEPMIKRILVAISVHT